MQYISINIIGGLGNQLFQIFAMIAHCIQHRIKFIIPYTHGFETRPTYWDNFLLGMKQFTTINKDNVFTVQDITRFDRIIEPNFHYNPI